MGIDIKLILENSKDLNVLYVEDDKDLRESTFKLLDNFFSRVDVAQDGKEGLEKYQSYFENAQENYDIVITDISMPNMDGIEMAKNMKNICHEQLIVFVTAFQKIEHLQSAIEIGSSGFLVKPIDIDQLKKVLYSTTQIVSDRKLVRVHYKQLADASVASIHLRDSTGYNQAKSILHDLEKNVDKISYYWMQQGSVHERLKKYNIDMEFFRKHYALAIINYFISVVKEENELGNCPVIFVMLDFLRTKNLQLEDLYTICVAFKNSVIDYILSSYTYNRQLYYDLSYILDTNFEGVIRNFVKQKNCDGHEDSKAIEVLMEEPSDKQEQVEFAKIDVSYSEYVLENDIYELHDLEEEIDRLAILATATNNFSIENTQNLGDTIYRYGTILTHYPIFTELGEYIIKLGTHISNNTDRLYYDKEKMHNISALLEAFVNDLIIWRKEIFEHNIEDYQFLNNSFFSNVDTIIMFIDYDESQSNESEESDIDFF